jgi:hypothetical protein
MESLREIFDNLERHCGKWESYFSVYEFYLSKYRYRCPSVVEVGICRGGSAEMWQKYFGNGATITGIDVDPNVANFVTPGCEQVLGDQGSPEFWDTFWDGRDDVDVLIDDGGHYPTQQIVTLQKCWPHIKPGGVLIVEDTHTNYWAEYGGSLSSPRSFLAYAKQITDTVNVDHWRGADRNPNSLAFAEFFKDLTSVTFVDSMVIFTKNGRVKNEIVTSTPI